MPTWFSSHCRQPVTKKRMLPISTDTKTTLSHTQVSLDSSTPPQILHSPISTSEITHPTSRSHTSPGSTARKMYFGHLENWMCILYRLFWAHPCWGVPFRRHNEREPALNCLTQLRVMLYLVVLPESKQWSCLPLCTSRFSSVTAPRLARAYEGQC